MTARAMVFAAGLGTRLRPLTDTLPKPVVPVLNRPLCAYAIDHLARAGFTEIVLNTHYLAERVETELARAGLPSGVNVRFARETELLGTAGGVRNAVAVQSRAVGAELHDDDVLVAFNGDVLFAPDLEAAVAHHRALGAYATMIVRSDPAAARYGAIEIDDDGRVQRILGRPETVPMATRARMFTGVHVLSGRCVRELPTVGCIVQQGYRPWLARGEVVAGFDEGAAWRDLGTPGEYLDANLDLLSGRSAWPGLERGSRAMLGRLGEGAEVVDSVIGEGAHVAPGVRLDRCVVWPGTVVTEHATRCVLAGDSRVPVV